MVNIGHFSAALATGAGLALSVAISPAQAQSLTPGACAFSDVTLNVGDALNCAQVNFGKGGNPTESAIGSAFGGSGTWTQLGLQAEGFPESGGSGQITQGSLVVSYDAGSKTGTWQFTSSQPYTSYAVALKGAKDSKAYLFSDLNGFGGILSGTWDGRALLTPNGKNQPALSNFRIYGSGPVDPVPEPLTILGTVAAAGIGYGLKRRRDSLNA